MKIRRFVIIENEQNLFFSKRRLYGYSLQNQIIYTVKFSRNLELAHKFYSETDANRFIDELPFTEHMLHICSSDCKAPLRLANLSVIPLSIVYDT